jgi:hypothetical protein
MGVEYFRLIWPDVYDGASSTMSEVPVAAWWAIGIGFLFLVYWTIKK